MARTKRKTNAKAATKQSLVADPAASTSSQNVKFSALELLAKADAILDESGDVELAAKFAERAQSLCVSEEEKSKCSEVMGICYLELGEEQRAKQLFEECRSSSSRALHYLAQLADSPEEAIANFKAAVDLLSTKVDIAAGSVGAPGKDKAWSTQERDIRIQITKALVGMTELYLTDLCMEPDAEARCTEYLDLAVRVDAGADINPEIYVTLASVRLSQCRPEEGQAALLKSFSIWRDEPPTSLNIPPFAARLNLARLLVEVEAYDEAIEVLEGLEDENDEEFEILYLLGLANWLIAEKSTQEEEKKEAYIDSREVLERFLQIQHKRPEECHPDMLSQVQELITALEKEKGVTMKEVDEQAARMAAEAGKKDSARRSGQTEDDEDGWEDDEDGDEVMA